VTRCAAPGNYDVDGLVYRFHITSALSIS
jgi:hypothetical protein